MRLEKLQDTINEELSTWVTVWGEVQEVVGVSAAADHGRVLAALRGLRRELEELKERQNSVARHAGFTSAGRLFQHIEAQPEGFLTGRQPQDQGVVLPEALLRDTPYWFKSGRDGQKPITQLQVPKWLREVQKVAREVLTDRPDLREQMVEAYRKNHPADFIEMCRRVFHDDQSSQAVEAEIVPTLGTQLAVMSGFTEWTQPEDRPGLEQCRANWDDEVDLRVYAEAKRLVKKDGLDREDNAEDLVGQYRLAHWLKTAGEEVLFGDIHSPTCLLLPENTFVKTAWDDLWEDRLEMLGRMKQGGLKAVLEVVEKRAKRLEAEG